ncbi:MAG TPA: enoyl-CoA hydratase/isomerase family protein [Burkholderiaceae bacterium]|jgi:enoyl-CoA hydratase/carnithine racemase|nr:enoyl-CoA hydratase/isomerase family protein [Burkholderiaceae bacterium]
MLAVAEGVGIVVLDRPERGNALSAELVEALHGAVERACADTSVHTLVLRARGRHFCTGFDLSELDAQTDATLFDRFVRIEMLLDALWRAPLRTVAIAHGRATGAGADLFAACDRRLLAPGAQLRFPGAGFGIVLGTRRLATRVGAATALQWVSEATTIDARAALTAGLASALLDRDPPVDEPAAAREAASSMAALAVPAVDRATFAVLRAATCGDGGDADLAALVRSAARPGLKERLVAYRDRQLAAR